MKYQSSFRQLIDWPNLLLAWHKASRGKRSNAAVALFESRLEDELFSLQEELQQKTWRPGGYTCFYIHDPKRRLISAAPFADRVVHHALCNIIEPGFERCFIKESFANRIGKGNHRALDFAQYCAKRHAYFLSLDIRKFFPCIDHEILRTLLARKISDDDVLWLIDLIVASGADIHDKENDTMLFPGDDLLVFTRARGLPIGNLTSQFWANVYLNPLDQFIKRRLRCRAYVRYVDDLLLFADAKPLLWEWLEQTSEFLAKLRLKFHDGSHPRPVTEGINFLGFRIFPDRRRLKRRKGIQYQRHLKVLIRQFEQGQLEADKLLDSVMAWNNHAGYANTIGLRKVVFSTLPEEIALQARRRYLHTLQRRKKP